jgi:hypothetical protein
MIKPKRSAEQQVADEADRKALALLASRQIRRFFGRPWTQAEDDKLRTLVIAGASSRAIGVQLNRTETAVRWGLAS